MFASQPPGSQPHRPVSGRGALPDFRGAIAWGAGAERRGDLSKDRETRRLLTSRPCSSFIYKESNPKNGYASAIGLCKDSISMQSRKPSNSDFWRPFNI